MFRKVEHSANKIKLNFKSKKQKNTVPWLSILVQARLGQSSCPD
jgi:hypothetical protein